jgi:signal transduction histidine kinase
MLTVILATAELLDGAVADKPAAQADLSELRAAARRGSAMVRKLLGFSRRERLTLQSVKLSGLLNESSRKFRDIFSASVELEITTEHTPEIRGDPRAIEEILVNLLTNARDAMPQGGRVHVHAGVGGVDAEHAHAHGWGVTGEYVCVTVTDTGTGMDEVTRARLFEPFFTTKPTKKGTGLGLTVAKAIVEMHGGTLTLANRARGGVQVLITLETKGDREDVAEAAAADR